MTTQKRARLSLDLDKQTKDAIERVRQETGKGSITELIKDSVAMYGQICSTQKGGGMVILGNRNGVQFVLANISI